MNGPSAAEIFEAARTSYEFGRTVRVARVEHRWTTRELADAAGTGEPVIIRCETGGIPPTAPVALRIVRALGREQVPAMPRVPAPRGGGIG
jgi:transcriptional regulator with XRE-family HTH domain